MQKASRPQQLTAGAPPKTTAFTFGEPVPVLDKRDILDYVECISNGKWYEPPVSFSGLAKSLRSAVHHSSPIYVKRNVLASTYIPHPLLSVRISAALRSTIWCSATPFLNSGTASPAS